MGYCPGTFELPGHKDGVLPGHKDGVLPGHIAEASGRAFAWASGWGLPRQLDGILPPPVLTRVSGQRVTHSVADVTGP